MSSRTDRFIPEEFYQAIINASGASESNPFATIADVVVMGVVTNYSSLPDPTTNSGKFYWVENTQGTRWLLGSLGGTFYNKGVYQL